MIYNNLTDDKCESLLGTKNEKQPQDLSNKQSVADDQNLNEGTTTGKDQDYLHIEGLENFSFISPPQDE
jgi:hypothetical protein